LRFPWVFSTGRLNISPKLDAYIACLSIRSFVGTLVPTFHDFTHEVLGLSVSFQGLLRA